jgi:hypothetical protein
MSEKAFRLDFFIAIAALLVSTISALALIYQTRVIGAQYAATIWPYLSVDSTYSGTGEKLVIENDGMGPALIRSAQLSLDGRKIRGWNDYFKVLLKDRTTYGYFADATAAIKAGKVIQGSITTASLEPGETIRPGDSITLLDFTLPGAPLKSMEKPTIELNLCYCSLNQSCWLLRDAQHTFAGSEPQPVSQCGAATSIEAPSQITFPSARPRKR